MAAATRGDARLAVALAAGGDRLREDASSPRAPAEDAFLERDLGPARAEVGREAVEELSALARAWTDAELVDVARSGELRVPTA